MKTTIKIAALALAVSALAGCAPTPPTPAFQLTDAQLCTEYGYSMAAGNAGRLTEVGDEAQRRMNANNGVLSVPKETCQALSQTGVNKYQADQIAYANQQRAAQALMAYGQQMQAQAAQQDAFQQQQLNQQAAQAQQSWQMQQQTQALQGINRSLQGY